MSSEPVLSPYSLKSVGRIALVGFMGSGKTAVGRLLAARMGLRHYDSDQAIEAACGRSVAALFGDVGEEEFRRRETEMLRQICAANPNELALSTGGGAVLSAENRHLLRQSAVVVWLTARADVILCRTEPEWEQRPLLAKGGENRLAHILGLLSERAPFYQKTAHLIVDTSDRTPDAIAAEILRKAERFWAAGK